MSEGIYICVVDECILVHDGSNLREPEWRGYSWHMCVKEFNLISLEVVWPLSVADIKSLYIQGIDSRIQVLNF